MIRKYLRILLLFIRVTFINNTASRGTFFLAVIGKMLRVVLLIVFFQAFFLRLSTFAGWEFREILVLSAVYLTIEFIGVITFHRNLAYYFPKTLQDGSLDLLLTKPINVLFHSAFRYIDAYDITSSFSVIVLWGYIFSTYEWHVSLVTVLFFLLFIGMSLVFYFSLFLLLASTGFWTVNATGVGRFLENILRISRYPTTIFQSGFRIIFLYIIPVSLFATLPSEIFLGRASTSYIIFGGAFTVLFFIAALRLWRFALKHYSSVSS